MASSLNTKINSYAIEKTIEFDQAYTTTPTQTGSFSTGLTFSLTGNAPTRVFDSPPGAGNSSWQFDWTTSSTTNTYYHNNLSTYRALFTDADYSIGLWFKVPTLPTDSGFYRIFELSSTSTAVGFTFDIMGTANTNGTFTGSKIRITHGASGASSQFGTEQLISDKWYYFALRRVGSTGSNYFAYLNGTQFANWSDTTTGSATRVIFGRNGAHGQTATYRISNFYSASSSVIGATEIAAIYESGNSGYEKGLTDLNITPYLWYKFDDSSGVDLVYDSGSSNQTLNLSSNPSWLTYPNTKSKGGLHLSAFAGYDAESTSPYGSNNTIAFWFKRPSAPASQLQWSNKFYTTVNKWSTAAEAGINTNGTITFAPTLGGTQQPALTSTTNICDGQWHYVVITRTGGTDARMYIDGSLQSSQTWGSATIVSSSFQPFMGLGNYFDDVIYWDTTALTSTQVANLYASTVTATNASVTAQVMLVTDASMTSATVTSESVVNITYNSEAFGGEFNTATMVGAMTSIEVNLDTPGVSTASADFVLPITTTTQSVDYPDSPSTATATMILPIISTQRYLDYSASPMTASALLSSNVYYGQTVQDNSYNLNIRKISYSNNSNANNGFAIGTQYTGTTVEDKTSLLLQSANGVPTLGTVIKAKFDPAHLTISATGNQGESNRFNIYVFTAAPTGGATWNNITYSNLPAKELISTTRVADDGVNPNYYLDITAASQDTRAYTYGIFIEHIQDTFTGTSAYDRVEYQGNGLDTKLMYLLTSDFVNKNVNAAPMTADAEHAMPVITAEKYIDLAVSPATASADIVNPTVEVQVGTAFDASALTASALSVQPTFNATFEITPDHMEADARTVTPTLDITGVVNYSASVSTASAIFHMPQYEIGENNSSDHMDATASFPTPLVVLSPTVAVMVATVSGSMVDPTIGGELLGSVSAQVMTAQAFLPVPSNYDPVTLDNWFNRLYTQDAVTPDKFGSILFMKPAKLSTTGTLGVGSVITSVGLNTDGTATAISAANAITSPTPAAAQGTYDGWNRKALAFNNISFRNRNPIGGSDTANRSVDRGYTLEAMIKTTKANQILFIGQNGYTFEANPIGLKDGKLFIKSSIAASLDVTDTRLLNATTLMQATKTNIADGQWHHILIQFGYDGRHQFWVDGELELQRYGYKTNYVNLIGYNSANSTLSSEFEISAFSVQAESFLSERDVQLNYFAAINFAPIQVEPMTASLGMTQDHTAKGNRGRALMLYFWSTRGVDNNSYYRGAQGGIDISLQRNTSFDQGSDYFDYDTGANLSTWELQDRAVQQWQGWDIFPIDVQGIYASSVVKPESYKNLFTATYFSGQNDISWKQAEGFYDEQTDNRRYIDLIKDIDNLEDFDMIFFRNYPDQGSELDSFSKFESVDSYFQLQEKTLFEDFLKSLRSAIDTGISLMVTNPQLAIDLGIIDRVEVVSQLDDQVGIASDAHAKATITGTTGGGYRTNDEAGNENTQFFYADTYTNNRHRLITEVDGLTTIPAYIWKETVYYNNDGAIDFGGNDRWWNKYDYKPNGIPAGDDFIIATYSAQKGNNFYQAVPFANIKAGKALTAFATTYNRNGTDVDNPYKNYATSIILEPGDTLNGRQIGGKIFVSFTETLQGVGDYDVPREYAQIDLVTDERINFAYQQGAITLAEKNLYLADTSKNLDRRLANGLITQEQYEGLTYWEDNGNNITSAIQYGNTEEVVNSGKPFYERGSGERFSPLNKYTLRPNQNTTTNFASDGPWFTISWGYTTPRVSIWVPSINVRAFSWLYNREFLQGKVQSHTAQNVYVSMPHPTVSADRQNSVNAQAMLSNATITQGAYSNSRSIAALPFEAIATMTQHVRNVNALPMTASVALRTTIGVLTSSVDEVVLYVHHEDPVLYLREEVIK